MLFRTIFIITFCFGWPCLHAQTAEQRVEQLIENKNWFLLDEEYPALKDSIHSPVMKLYTEMLLKIYFNALPGVMDDIYNLLANYQSELGNKVVDVVIYESMMLARMGYYGDAADRMYEVINLVSPSTPKEHLTDLVAFADYYNRLRQVKPFGGKRSGKDIEIPFTLVKVGRNDGVLMFIPVYIHGVEYKFILDTGATGMVMSKKMADAIGLKPIADSKIRGSVGEKMGKVSTIDSIRVGDIIFRNPLVHIIPPDPTVDSVYQLDAVLGVDFMNLMGEIQIYPNENKIVFPMKQTSLPGSGRNMMVDDGMYYLKVFSGSKRLKMLFDSGAVGSHLFSPYYSKYQAEVDLMGKKDTISLGGVGGYEKRQVLCLDSISLTLGDIAFSLKNIAVIPDQKKAFQKDEDGNVGMSFIRSFSKIIINFSNMFVTVE